MALIDHEYDNIQRAEMSAEETAAVQSLFDQLRAQYKAFGFSATAVDTLVFEITKHTLTLSQDEKDKGQQHMFADGKPFYALNVGSDTSLQWLQIDEDRTPARGSDPQQKAWIAIDVMNLMQILEDYAVENLGADAKKKGRGKPNGNFVIANYELLTRQSPEQIAKALVDVIKIRLDMMNEKFNPKPKAADTGDPAAPSAPKANNDILPDLPSF